MNPNTICANCGHEYQFHVRPDGKPMPCDHEVEKTQHATGYADMDVVTSCGCEDFDVDERTL